MAEGVNLMTRRLALCWGWLFQNQGWKQFIFQTSRIIVRSLSCSWAMLLRTAGMLWLSWFKRFKNPWTCANRAGMIVLEMTVRTNPRIGCWNWPMPNCLFQGGTTMFNRCCPLFLPHPTSLKTVWKHRLTRRSAASPSTEVPLAAPEARVAPPQFGAPNLQVTWPKPWPIFCSMIHIPVVPHKAVAEVSKIGNL